MTAATSASLPTVQLALFPGAPAADTGQRWRDRRGTWAPRSGATFDPSRHDVTPIDDDATARAFIEQHHYSGSYPAARLRYGLTDRDTGRLLGVAVLSVPMRADVLTRPLPGLEPYTESLELGRFVLLDEVPFNGESWFLARAFRLAALAGIVGVVSFSDPMARTTTAGQTVFAGHIGGIYQATNAVYCGLGTGRTLHLLPDGGVLSARAMSKVRGQERGHDYVERQLMAYGARAPRAGETGQAWLRQALADVGVRKATHPGNHRYVFPIGTPAQRRAVQIGMPAGQYPKQAAA